jgi:hypothetical protein
MDSDYPFGNSSLFIPVISYFCCRVYDKYFMLVSLCPTLFLGINDIRIVSRRRSPKCKTWTNWVALTLNNYLQHIIHKIKDRATRTPLKTGGELRCSRRVGRSCSTCGTHRVTLVKYYCNMIAFSVLVDCISNLVRKTCFWNNIHQVCSKSKVWKDK